jgi:hypothetical protein
VAELVVKNNIFGGTAWLFVVGSSRQNTGIFLEIGLDKYFDYADMPTTLLWHKKCFSLTG